MVPGRRAGKRNPFPFLVSVSAMNSAAAAAIETTRRRRGLARARRRPGVRATHINEATATAGATQATAENQ